MSRLRFSDWVVLKQGIEIQNWYNQLHILR